MEPVLDTPLPDPEYQYLNSPFRYLLLGLMVVGPVALFVWLGGMRYVRRLVGGAVDKKGKRRSGGAYQMVETEADLEK